MALGSAEIILNIFLHAWLPSLVTSRLHGSASCGINGHQGLDRKQAFN